MAESMVGLSAVRKDNEMVEKKVDMSVEQKDQYSVAE